MDIALVHPPSPDIKLDQEFRIALYEEYRTNNSFFCVLCISFIGSGELSDFHTHVDIHLRDRCRRGGFVSGQLPVPRMEKPMKATLGNNILLPKHHHEVHAKMLQRKRKISRQKSAWNVSAKYTTIPSAQAVTVAGSVPAPNTRYHPTSRSPVQRSPSLQSCSSDDSGNISSISSLHSFPSTRPSTDPVTVLSTPPRRAKKEPLFAPDSSPIKPDPEAFGPPSPHGIHHDGTLLVEPIFPQVTPPSPGRCAIAQFLREMPRTLDHLVPLFIELGITNAQVLDVLCEQDEQDLDSLFKTSDFTYIERSYIKDGLAARRKRFPSGCELGAPTVTLNLADLEDQSDPVRTFFRSLRVQKPRYYNIITSKPFGCGKDTDLYQLAIKPDLQGVLRNQLEENGMPILEWMYLKQELKKVKIALEQRESDDVSASYP